MLAAFGKVGKSPCRLSEPKGKRRRVIRGGLVTSFSRRLRPLRRHSPSALILQANVRPCRTLASVFHSAFSSLLPLRFPVPAPPRRRFSPARARFSPPSAWPPAAGLRLRHPPSDRASIYGGCESLRHIRGRQRLRGVGNRPWPPRALQTISRQSKSSKCLATLPPHPHQARFHQRSSARVHRCELLQRCAIFRLVQFHISLWSLGSISYRSISPFSCSSLPSSFQRDSARAGADLFFEKSALRFMCQRMAAIIAASPSAEIASMSAEAAVVVFW